MRLRRLDLHPVIVRINPIIGRILLSYPRTPDKRIIDPVGSIIYMV